MAHGPIPKGMCVCHTCDTPACVEVTHLFLGTVGDNNRDMFQKGRGNPPTARAVGSRHGSAKLIELDVIILRVRASAGESYSSLARQYGVCVQSVSNIVHRKVWTHI